MNEAVNVAWCGLGEMGEPMAAHVLAAGHRVAAWNRSPRKAQDVVAAGATLAPTPAAAARDADVAFVMVWDVAAVEQVIFGPDGLAETLAPGAVVVDCSTTTPEYAIACARRLAERGIEFLEAPVSGRREGAESATLTVMAGGPRDLFERVLPLLEAFGANVVLVGPHGCGQAVKLAGNVIAIVGVASIAEGLALAERCGAEPQATLAALIGSTARSPMLEAFGPRIAAADFAPGVTSALALKDLEAAAQAAAGAGSAAPLAACAAGLYGRLVERGYGREGLHAVARVM
ncbi:NAD(P)-dependent oxidoreductase [Conexibacter sp. CPCC 206217]|uniref:NAD(P)-dependent oxidoreductase n=1 Tax=Conexibacter sp. CPCC 206217 TaxID=3064574 RepID=UPI0027285221|nr:NAD(P)-dependent oxidoreductase [Conexibacter sp. CPCC 206217]MDO8213552.1 NAD(P)-dependent oxidoreductase [Conexibacter sp. CPCC 206217]